MTEWLPIAEFDYEQESARQGTIFVLAWVSDGSRVEIAEHWSDGWREVLDVGPGGPYPLGWEPVLWMRPPSPPGLLALARAGIDPRPEPGDTTGPGLTKTPANP